MPTTCPLCAEPFENIDLFARHLPVHTLSELGGILVQAVRYRESAKFATMNAARLAYRRLVEALTTPRGRPYDIGIMAGAWSANRSDPVTPVVVVTSMHTLPNDVMRYVASVLGECGRPWAAPDDFILSITLRRLRNIRAGAGELQPNGVMRYANTGLNERIDALGNTVGDVARGV